jgi:selenocysteine lyase/cysteine desulfurase
MPLLAKSEFVGLEQVTHLATGGEAPWRRSHDQATAHMGALKSGGMAGREQLFAVYERAKSRVARMLGVDPSRVAFLGHASEGLNQAVKAVSWRAGDNVVFADLEYQSSIYPAALLRETGVDVRVLRTRDHYLSLEPHAQDLAERLARQGVLVWGGEGRIRVSTHIYNDRKDVRRLLDVLDALGTRDARAGA